MIAPIVTRGFGSFGGVSLLPTRGYGIGEAIPEPPVIAARGDGAGGGGGRQAKWWHDEEKKPWDKREERDERDRDLDGEIRFTVSLDFAAEGDGEFEREEEVGYPEPTVPRRSWWRPETFRVGRPEPVRPEPPKRKSAQVAQIFPVPPRRVVGDAALVRLPPRDVAAVGEATFGAEIALGGECYVFYSRRGAPDLEQLRALDEILIMQDRARLGTN